MGVDHLLGEHQRAAVVAALAGVLLRIVEAEAGHEATDRLAELFVVVGEGEVLALGSEGGLEYVGGGGRALTVPARAREVDMRPS